jgi:biopolymer transport protein ExbB
VSEEETFFSSVLRHGLAELSESHDAAEYAIIEASEEQASRIFSKIEYLNIIGNVSPMIGLIGTVYGIILAFNTLADIVRQGGVSRPDQLAEGISIALVNTFWGLIIAVPALAVYGFLRNRVELLASEAAGLATDLIRSIDPEDAVLYRQFSQKEKGSD